MKTPADKYRDALPALNGISFLVVFLLFADCIYHKPS